MDNEHPEPESPPSVDAPTSSKLLFLQERMVNFTQQYSMPVVEVSLVLSKYTKQISTHLSAHAAEQGEELPERLSQPWPLEAGILLLMLGKIPNSRSTRCLTWSMGIASTSSTRSSAT